MDHKKFNLVMSILGLAILIFLVSTLDYNYVKNFSFSFSFMNVLALILVIFIIFFVRTIRWMVYLKSIDVDISFKDAYLIAVPSIAIALFTPAQSGDLLKIEYLKKQKNVPRRQSISTIFVEKMMDLLLIFIVFLIAISYFSLKVLNLNYYLVTVALLIGVAIFLILSYTLYKKYDIMKTILINVRKIIVNFKTMFYALVLTMIYWTLICLSWIFVADIVNLKISFLQMFGIMSIGSILGLISFIPGALGVMEYSTVILLTTFLLVPMNKATIFVLLHRFYAILMYIIAYIHLVSKKS